MKKKELIIRINTLATEYCESRIQDSALNRKTIPALQEKLKGYETMMILEQHARKILAAHSENERLAASITYPPPEWYRRANILRQVALRIWSK